MADIDLERRRGGGHWLWWLVAAAVVALIVWWAWPEGEPDVADTNFDTEPTAEVQPLPEPAPGTMGEQSGVTVAQIAESPATYTGQTVSSEVRVTDVPTDRGFWVEDQGQRLFVLVVDQPQEQPIDIQPNSTVRLEQATVRDARDVANLPGTPVDPDTEQILRDQDVFLTVQQQNIQPVEQVGAPENSPEGEM